MEMAIILFNKLLSLFILIGVGFVMVRSGLLKSEDSRSLSMLSLYVVCPIAVMNGFEVDCTPEVLSGILLAFCFALLTHVVFILGTQLLSKPLRLSALEKASVIYPNTGILTIPIVSSILGQEWVIYTCTYTAIQIVLLWSHCRMLISGEKRIELKKILLNSNMIAMYVGVFMLFTGFRFPGPIDSAIDSISAMIGPVGMFVTGMIIGGMKLKNVFIFPRAWLTALLRLVVLPVIMCLIAKFSGLSRILPTAETVLMISMLSLSGPAGSTVLQMSRIYNSQETAEYASSINIITMLLCAVTMPLIIALYFL